MTAPRRPAPTLAERVGRPAAEALRQWAVHQGVTVGVPDDAWRPTAGFTGAVLRRLVVTDLASGDADEVLVKVCPPGRLEGGGHRRAWADSAGEEGNRAHLVEPYRCDWPAADGSLLTLQRLAGRGDGIRLLSELPHEDLLPALDAVVRWLRDGWNRGHARVSDCSVRGLLTDRLAGQLAMGSIARWTADTALAGPGVAWLRLDPDGPPLPSPLLLTTAAANDLRCTAELGRAHRDLHLDNAVVPWPGAPDRFQLIDLATYDTATPLTLDPVTLLLAAVVRNPPAELGEPLQRAILGAETTATGAAFDVVATVRAAHGAFDPALERAWQVSVAGTALLFTTFERLGPGVRWWCFTLACHAAALLLPGGPRGSDTPVVTNPFGGTTTAPTPAPAGAGLLVTATRRAATGDRAGAAALVELLARQLIAEPAGKPAEQVRRLDRLRADAARILDETATVLFDLDHARARARWDRRDPEPSRELMAETHDRAKALLGHEHPVTVRLGRALASTLYT